MEEAPLAVDVRRHPLRYVHSGDYRDARGRNGRSSDNSQEQGRHLLNMVGTGSSGKRKCCLRRRFNILAAHPAKIYQLLRKPMNISLEKGMNARKVQGVSCLGRTHTPYPSPAQGCPEPISVNATEGTGGGGRHVLSDAARGGLEVGE